MTSLSQVPVEVIRAEAAAIRQLLVAHRWGVELEPVRLDEERSPLVRAFWEELGWDRDLAGFQLANPVLSDGRATAREWEIEYGGYDPERQAFSALPARCRAVYRDNDGAAFMVTDETGDADDPPLVCLSGGEEEGDENEPFLDSYLRWMGTTMVETALEGWYCAWVRSEPGLDDLAPQQPFPNLAPGARRISDDLWVVPDAMEDEPCGCVLAARRFEALGEWFAAAPRLRRISLDKLPGERHPVAATPEVVRAEPGSWVEVSGMKTGHAYRIGALGEVPVIFDLHDGEVTVAASPRDREAIKIELSGRSW